MNTRRILYILTLLGAFVLFFFGPILAFAADSGACYAVGSPDARAYCLAKAHKDPGRCYAIQDPARRAECLSEVR